MIFSAFVCSFVRYFIFRKGRFGVFIAIECNVDCCGSNFYGNYIFIFSDFRKNISAVGAFSLFAFGAGLVCEAYGIIALCTFYGFIVGAIIFRGIGCMLLISGACFLCGAYNLAAFFAGNGYGVVAVALCGIGCFGFGADMVAGSGRNGCFDFYIFGAEVGTVLHKTGFYSCGELCRLLFGYIVLCGKGYLAVLTRRDGTETATAHFNMSD